MKLLKPNHPCFEDILHYSDHTLTLFCCVECGISLAWCTDKKNRKTKQERYLARYCPNGETPDGRHVWGISR